MRVKRGANKRRERTYVLRAVVSIATGAVGWCRRGAPGYLSRPAECNGEALERWRDVMPAQVGVVDGGRVDEGGQAAAGSLAEMASQSRAEQSGESGRVECREDVEEEESGWMRWRCKSESRDFGPDWGGTGREGNFHLGRPDGDN